MDRRDFLKTLVVPPTLLVVGNVFGNNTPINHNTLRSISDGIRSKDKLDLSLLGEAVNFVSNSRGRYVPERYVLDMPIFETKRKFGSTGRLTHIIGDVIMRPDYESYIHEHGLKIGRKLENYEGELAIELAQKTKSIVRLFWIHHQKYLSKNSTLVCSNINTGGFSLRQLSEHHYRIMWQIGVV